MLTLRKWVLGSLLALSALPASAFATVGPEAVPGVTRPAILVGNNWDGTTDIVDPGTFERLDRVNVVPDLAERMGEITAAPDRIVYFFLIRQEIGEGHDQFNDDVFSSHDGRTIFVSRPSLADVVAIDLATKKIKWRAPVDGYRSDHMAISDDGAKLLVSASTGNVVHELDTATGKRTGVFESGDSPHENVYSPDQKRIYHASIGRVYAPSDQPVVDGPSKGGQFFQVVDADSLKILKRIDIGAKLEEAGHPDMSSAVRPMALAPDEHFVYFQVSFFHGFVEYDLRKDKVTRVAELPLTEASKDIPRENYLLDSAHHGLALDPTGHKLCVAGTMSDYGAIVHRDDFSYKIVDDHITKPYWSTNSGDGRYCYISASGDDRVVVVSYATEKVVHRFGVGDHPQRVRNGVVRLEQYPRKATGRFGLKVRSVKGVRRAACSSRVELVRCRVTVRAKSRVIGRGERFRRGAKTLTVRIGLTRSGRRLLRRGLRRATLTATGTDTAGRTRRASARVKLDR
jgi:DNA-binding beta-propeller fold protein YncE